MKHLRKYVQTVYTGLWLVPLFLIFGLALTPLSAANGDEPAAMHSPAPELTGSEWLNTPKGSSLKLSSRKGKVTIVHFWTFGCINCKHNLPAYARWQKLLASQDVAIIGVHTPETRGEAKSTNVAKFVKQRGITYPVLIDSDSKNWSRWHQNYWPTVYLIDKKGNIRYRWEGELEYNNAGGEAKMAGLVRELLKEGE